MVGITDSMVSFLREYWQPISLATHVACLSHQVLITQRQAPELVLGPDLRQGAPQPQRRRTSAG